MKLRIFTEPQQGAGYQRLLALARLAEQLGFGGFFVSDHYLVMGTRDRKSTRLNSSHVKRSRMPSSA